MRNFLLATAGGGVMLFVAAGVALGWSEQDCKNKCAATLWGGMTQSQCEMKNQCSQYRGQKSAGAKAVKASSERYNRERR